MHVFKTITVAASLPLCLLSPAMADVLTDWNEKVVAASIAARQPPPAQTRSIAMDLPRFGGGVRIFVQGI
jgi:hypothetical protein